ncbi:MAG TPA: DMT family transporter [Polyangiaceae bacterium]|nr:DMT family transporter [Polyangiaceae bacterium]
MLSESTPPAARRESPSESARQRSAARTRVIGALWVFVSSIAFSTKAILVKLAYRQGADSVSLLALRFGFAAPFFAYAAYGDRLRGTVSNRLTRRDAATIVALGVLGYYLASLSDFIGLRYISAGLERLILFVYPTLVVVIEAGLFKIRLERRQTLALVITYAGIFLAFRTDVGNLGSDVPRGAAWVFASALTYALYLIGAGRMVPRLGSQRFTALALLSATGAVLLHAALSGARLVGLPPTVYAIGFVMALLSTVLPAFLLARGIGLIGSGPAAIVSTVGPVSTILLAYLVLDEAISSGEFLGTALVVVGATLVASSSKREKARARTEPSASS